MLGPDSVRLKKIQRRYKDMKYYFIDIGSCYVFTDDIGGRIYKTDSGEYIKFMGTQILVATSTDEDPYLSKTKTPDGYNNSTIYGLSRKVYKKFAYKVLTDDDKEIVGYKNWDLPSVQKNGTPEVAGKWNIYKVHDAYREFLYFQFCDNKYRFKKDKWVLMCDGYIHYIADYTEEIIKRDLIKENRNLKRIICTFSALSFIGLASLLFKNINKTNTIPIL